MSCCAEGSNEMTRYHTTFNAVVDAFETRDAERKVSWRTCPHCDRSYPYRADTAKNIVVCRDCAVTIAVRTAVALATAGIGVGYGGHDGGRR